MLIAALFTIARTAEATQMSIHRIMDKEDVVYVRSFDKLCPSLCHPMDCSLPGSSVHGIFQARILEWVAISSSGDLPNPEIELQSHTLQADSLPFVPPGKPN